MSSSVASGFSSRVGRNSIRKYNIDEKFAKVRFLVSCFYFIKVTAHQPFLFLLNQSPYLLNPIGKLDKRRRSSKSLGGEQKPAKSPRRRNNDSDVESVLTKHSVRSYRSTSQTSTYKRSMSSSNTGRLMNMKNLLLPREVDKLLRGFRQKHSNHPILTNRPSSGDDDQDDTSTIASDFALSIDDETVYKKCNADVQVKEALFSSDLFAAITLRSAGKHFKTGEDIVLPPVFPVVAVDKGGDISDLESVHSVVDNVRVTRSKSSKRR